MYISVQLHCAFYICPDVLASYMIKPCFSKYFIMCLFQLFLALVCFVFVVSYLVSALYDIIGLITLL
jgi:hypothetical protein